MAASHRSSAAPELLELVERVYAAAIDPAGWNAFLEGFARTTGSEIASMMVEDVDTRQEYMTRLPDGPWSYGVPEWAIAQYPEWTPRNVIMQAAAPLMRTGVVFEHNPVSKRDLLRSEFYQDFQRRFATGLDVMGACIVFDAPITVALSATRCARRPDYAADEHRVIRTLLPHLQCALSIHRRLAAIELERSAFGDLFDQLGSAVLVLDERGRVIVYNRTANAILAAGDGLSLQPGGELAAAGPADDALLRRLIGDACLTGTGRGLGAGGALQIRRPTARQPYAVIVSPLRLPHMLLVTQRPAAVVFITDFDQRRGGADVLQSLFRLTSAEVKVGELLAAGHRAADIADRLQVALPTVRTHIRRLLDKTGARGQSDLVRLLLMAPPMLTRSRHPSATCGTERATDEA